MEIRKILTSRNHQFINPLKVSPSPRDKIKITPNNVHEGELSNGDSICTNQHGSTKRKADQMNIQSTMINLRELEEYASITYT